MRILKLPTHVANQIAAGEVIERPASIVKELLENALDAKADAINIEISFGGLNQIKISDNGLGIVAEDLPLAIAPHATSKITKLNDLYAIQSMGFRGEALASIASIARLSISSKPALQETGRMLETNGQDVKVTPCARSQGTTIDVRDIFFNAPIRKKFLKSERSEFQAIDNVAKRFALSSPTIAIQLNHNGKQQWHLPAALDDYSRKTRMAKLFGKSFVDQSIYIDAQHTGIQLHGWVSSLNYQRSQNDKLWVYVNGRIVRDKLINHALKQAYENLLHPGKNPSCLLYLTIDPALVDVNVHPTKHEVRFQQPRFVHDFISSQLGYVLKSPIVLLPSVKQRKAFEVRETYPSPLYPPKEGQIVNTKVADSNWTLLNQRYALVSFENKPYLVDMMKMQRAWFLDCLQKASLPLSCRPLLVPIYFEYEGTALVFETKKSLLNVIGIHIECVKENQYIIRSIPLLFPHLDLNSFLTDFFISSILNTQPLFELLADHFILPISTLSESERAKYLDYLQTMKDSPFIKHLSEEVCQELLDE